MQRKAKIISFHNRESETQRKQKHLPTFNPAKQQRGTAESAESESQAVNTECPENKKSVTQAFV